MASKIIITNETVLKRKYTDDGWQVIMAYVDMMIGTDQTSRGIASYVIAVDNPAQMKSFGASAVTDPSSQKQNKQAVDKVCRKMKPDHVLFLGGPDIIPFQDLEDPCGGAEKIPSDLPYACENGYSTSVKNFLVPVRQVSRLPDDCNSIVDIRNFMNTILNANRQKTRSIEEYHSVFAVAAENLKTGKEDSIKKMFGEETQILTCPPETGSWKKDLYFRMFHYFLLYGKEGSAKWFEDMECKNSVYESFGNKINVSQGNLAFSMVSYGAQLNTGDIPLAITYMAKGSCGFLGVTSEIQDMSMRNSPGDRLVEGFIQSVKKGNCMDQAFLEARQQLLSQSVSQKEMATLAQWVLYADGCIIPMKAKERK